MIEKIRSIVTENIAVQTALLNDETLLAAIIKVVGQVVAVFNKNGKVLFCGNGGSAADAQHLAAELSGRFYLDRKPLFAEALHVNSSFLTAVANDYGYDAVFARAVEAMGRPGDMLFALSTSGNSTNILRAAYAAKEREMLVVGMTGKSGGKLESICDFQLKIPTEKTPRVQEGHILVGHIICELAEAALFNP
ncbi:MAG: SIS domain-containing protein [Lewinellaceae bacterium]|nr:SIS domain-containing protein [Saprospiraceae bacterium]MCB9340140.1 SIS domain-containing protein [Lewinellaceae bacterium]